MKLHINSEIDLTKSYVMGNKVVNKDELKEFDHTDCMVYKLKRLEKSKNITITYLPIMSLEGEVMLDALLESSRFDIDRELVFEKIHNEKKYFSDKYVELETYIENENLDLDMEKSEIIDFKRFCKKMGEDSPALKDSNNEKITMEMIIKKMGDDGGARTEIFGIGKTLSKK